jgi:hypothetical protein
MAREQAAVRALVQVLGQDRMELLAALVQVPAVVQLQLELELEPGPPVMAARLFLP